MKEDVKERDPNGNLDGSKHPVRCTLIYRAIDVSSWRELAEGQDHADIWMQSL